MRSFIVTASAVLLAACNGHTADSGRSIAVVNPGFEQTAADGSIPGWKTAQHAGPPSYEMVIDTQDAFKGKSSFRITRTREQVYGSVMQDVAVGDAAGGSVELSVMVKAKDVGAKGLKLVILGQGVRELSPALNGSGDWKRVSLRAQLPKGISTISIGATLLDDGSVWLDEVELRVAAP